MAYGCTFFVSLKFFFKKKDKELSTGILIMLNMCKLWDYMTIRSSVFSKSSIEEVDTHCHLTLELGSCNTAF